MLIISNHITKRADKLLIRLLIISSLLYPTQFSYSQKTPYKDSISLKREIDSVLKKHGLKSSGFAINVVSLNQQGGQIAYSITNNYYSDPNYIPDSVNFIVDVKTKDGKKTFYFSPKNGVWAIPYIGYDSTIGNREIPFQGLIGTFENEKPKLWLEAFGAPHLYSQLIDKFDGHAIPTELITHLIRYYDIAEKAAPIAAEIFLTNAKFSGALGDNGILNYKNLLQKVSDPNFKSTDKPLEVESDNPGTIKEEDKTPAKNQIIPPQQKLIPQIVNPEEVTIRLTKGRIAILIYPLDIVAKDVEILEKQIEQLKIIAGAN